ncbi:sugar phosphate isomerase/epimerase family protein [Alienimonas sp. DA493]|uniref:sugar phosphate isomerase/epimerase family protein n=1 Tax=Alienimonas sp. DA493 TaxID=3373605 RepID=UPI0037551BFC
MTTAPISRRTALAGAALAGAALLAARASAGGARPNCDSEPGDGEPGQPNRGRLGLTVWACKCLRKVRRAAGGPDLNDPFVFLEHCRQLGAGGMQIPLGVMEPADAERLGAWAAEHGMYVDAVVRLPAERDAEQFAAQLETAARAGAAAARTHLFPGRRYEEFDSRAGFEDALAEGKRRLARAAPLAEAAGVPLAIENHKDQRLGPRVDLLEAYDSPFVRACVDFGNNVALLDDPYETVEALAPFAASVHVKDQSLTPTPDGFLLGDVPLGAGSLDLPRMVRAVRAAWPAANFSLELITRDPLNVPCLTDGFYATFPDLPARDLARTLRLVRANPTAGQKISTLSPEAAAERESRNVRESLAYARRELNL